MQHDHHDWQKLSDGYFSEARSLFIESAKSILQVSTWLLGFALIWTQIAFPDISQLQTWLVSGILLALFAAIVFSLWVIRGAHQFLNESADYFADLAEGKPRDELKNELVPWQARIAEWALGLGFVLTLGLVATVLWQG